MFENKFIKFFSKKKQYISETDNIIISDVDEYVLIENKKLNKTNILFDELEKTIAESVKNFDELMLQNIELEKIIENLNKLMLENIELKKIIENLKNEKFK